MIEILGEEFRLKWVFKGRKRGVWRKEKKIEGVRKRGFCLLVLL